MPAVFNTTPQFSDSICRQLEQSLAPAPEVRQRRKVRTATASIQDIYSRAPEGRHFPDNPKPSDHLLFLHGGPGSGNRSVCLRRLQAVSDQMDSGLHKSPSIKIRLSSLLEHIDDLVDEPNLFLAQADYFWGPRHDKNRRRSTSKYLQSIGTVFVDLDVYTVQKWAQVPVQEIQEALLASCEAAGVPNPVLISSGRGLYANWKLTDRVDLRDTNQRCRWERLQRKLMALLVDFGPDSKVRDATRILRLVGTINPRSQSRVHVLYDDGASYSLEHLEQCAHSLSDTLYASCEQKSRKGPRSKKRKAPPALVGASANHQDLDLPRCDPEAMHFLTQMLEQDKAITAKLSRHRLYQYRLFADIAKVIQLRGGIEYGDRDEFLFWLLVMRYNAGLFESYQLEALAHRFAGLTQGELNIWKNGALSTLYARMRAQEKLHGAYQVPSDRVVRKRAGFHVVRPYARITRPAGAQPLGHGEGYDRPVVYTSKASTLVERLGITPEEQAQLDCLIGHGEKARRKRAKSAQAKRQQRNERLIRQVVQSDKPIAQIVKRHQVSAATVYRVLAQSEHLKQSRAQRQEQMRQAKLRLIALLNDHPHASIRQLALMAQVPLSTAHRWICSHRLHAEQLLQRDRRLQIDAHIRQAAISKPVPFHGKASIKKCLFGSHKRTDKNSVSPSFESPFCTVPISHCESHSIKGIEAGKGIVKMEGYAGPGTNSYLDIKALGSSREAVPAQVMDKQPQANVLALAKGVSPPEGSKKSSVPRNRFRFYPDVLGAVLPAPHGSTPSHRPKVTSMDANTGKIGSDERLDFGALLAKARVRIQDKSPIPEIPGIEFEGSLAQKEPIARCWSEEIQSVMRQSKVQDDNPFE